MGRVGGTDTGREGGWIEWEVLVLLLRIWLLLAIAEVDDDSCEKVGFLFGGRPVVDEEDGTVVIGLGRISRYFLIVGVRGVTNWSTRFGKATL